MVVRSEAEQSLHQSVSSAFNDESTSDLKILTDGKVIHVHKALLKIRYETNSCTKRSDLIFCNITKRTTC